MRILIVEDEPVSREVLEKMLKEHGECDIAEDGEAALAAFRRAHSEGRPYELICLDIMIPKLDGQRVLESLRKEELEFGVSGLTGVKIIMTTALGDAKNVLSSFKAGCEAYLTKPIDKRKLAETISKLGLAQ